MSREVKLRPRALRDLAEIWDHTDQRWGAGQARAYLTGLDAAFGLLAEFPEMARLRHEIEPPVRIHPYRAHLVIYVASPGELDVLRVVHARADWSDFLAD